MWSMLAGSAARVSAIGASVLSRSIASATSADVSSASECWLQPAKIEIPQLTTVCRVFGRRRAKETLLVLGCIIAMVLAIGEARIVPAKSGTCVVDQHIDAGAVKRRRGIRCCTLQRVRASQQVERQHMVLLMAAELLALGCDCLPTSQATNSPANSTSILKEAGSVGCLVAEIVANLCASQLASAAACLTEIASFVDGKQCLWRTCSRSCRRADRMRRAP